MSASDIFLIGSSGLRAYQTQLSTISQNISNVGSSNYSRRTATISESVVSGSDRVLYRQQANFGGANATGIQRTSDEFLNAQARTTGGELAYSNSYLKWANSVESALNDSDTGIGTTLTSFYSSVDQLAANPADNSLRTSMLYQLEQVTTAFRTSANDLNDVLDQTYESANSDISLLNNALSGLKDINQSLQRAISGTANQAQLLDSRDALLSTITGKLNATVTLDANGAATVTYDGQTLADVSTSGSFSVVQGTDKTFSLMLNGTTAVATPTAGTLAGDFAGSANARDQLDALDGLAVEFATDLNAWHQQGVTDGGTTGLDIVSVGTTADSLQPAITDVADIAVKSTDGTINGNLVQIDTVRQNSDVENKWTQIVTAQGNLVSTVSDEQTLAANRDEIARNAREEVSGVSLDVEAADLLRVQQAYQACARVVQAAKDIVDAILNLN